MATNLKSELRIMPTAYLATHFTNYYMQEAIDGEGDAGEVQNDTPFFAHRIFLTDAYAF